jgi:asparagine synthetase B (glutamine-hydrolysing)
MCGIVGILKKAGKFVTSDELDIFSQMLYCDALRGFDSTGIFGVDRVGNVDYIKTCDEASDLLESTEYKAWRQHMLFEAHCVFGHNRNATVGAHTDANAHPFIKDNTILIHNGTCYTHKDIAEASVDSEAICIGMTTLGYEKTIKLINGGTALVWYDAETHLLRIYRNKDRPLWMIETPNAFYVASEPQMLRWLLERNKVEILGVDKFFAEDQIYTANLLAPELEFEAEIIKCEGVLPPKKTYSQYYHEYEHDSYASTFLEKNKPTYLPSPTKPALLEKDEPLTPEELCNYTVGEDVVFKIKYVTAVQDHSTIHGETVCDDAYLVRVHLDYKELTAPVCRTIEGHRGELMGTIESIELSRTHYKCDVVLNLKDPILVEESQYA